MKKGSRPLLKWLTAFILSPGMIFTTAYFLVWLSTNIYLARTFKPQLQNLIVTENGQRYQLDIGSLRSGLDLNSITLKKLALTPLDQNQNHETTPSALHIDEIRIDCPDIGIFPFDQGETMLSMHLLSRKILSSAAQ